MRRRSDVFSLLSYEETTVATRKGIRTHRSVGKQVEEGDKEEEKREWPLIGSLQADLQSLGPGIDVYASFRFSQVLPDSSFSLLSGQSNFLQDLSFKNYALFLLLSSGLEDLCCFSLWSSRVVVLETGSFSVQTTDNGAHIMIQKFLS
ncbi:hypothetical protein Cni_G14866 [Canna indica]|uniref:Uncharacterized protein n=1 Tax=Canna indica TaxID=4628 RepID=A0AAQ3QCS2_9LILI|nr:hypothetical protein Cni_G14866 [Canna indica]